MQDKKYELKPDQKLKITDNEKGNNDATTSKNLSEIRIPMIREAKDTELETLQKK